MLHQTLIKFISSSKVDEVAIEQKDFKIRIKRNAQTVTATVPKPIAVQEVPVVQEAVHADDVGLGEMGSTLLKKLSDGDVYVDSVKLWHYKRDEKNSYC